VRSCHVEAAAAFFSNLPPTRLAKVLAMSARDFMATERSARHLPGKRHCSTFTIVGLKYPFMTSIPSQPHLLFVQNLSVEEIGRSGWGEPSSWDLDR